MTSAISLSGVHKSFRPNTTWSDILRGRFTRTPVAALRGVSLEIGTGELVGLVGPNGAGKSTLLRSVAGLLLPDEGRVTVLGRSSEQDDADFKRAVGYAVADERSHFWRLSGRENLRFFASLHGLIGERRRARVSRALEIVGLEAQAERPVREYSTGMKQRLAVARGLLGQPQVLLLDEPTRGLDPGNAERIRAFVLDELVGRRAMTVVYATHSVDEMRSFCPRLVVLSEGAVAADGPFTQVSGTFGEVFA